MFVPHATIKGFFLSKDNIWWPASLSGKRRAFFVVTKLTFSGAHPRRFSVSTSQKTTCNPLLSAGVEAPVGV
jgi:hypothetical protein